MSHFDKKRTYSIKLYIMLLSFNCNSSNDICIFYPEFLSPSKGWT